MSVKVMAAVWECEALDQSERLVMLALADHSDDDGRCYPSISRLCKRTSMTDRGVQKVIARLVEKGFVSIVQNGGRGGANLYLVSATPTVPVVAVAPDASSRDVDAQLRWRVYKRDAYSCRYCGFQGHEDGHNLTVDHIVPVSKGGTNAESNLNTCCFSCNSSKKNKDLDAWLEHRVNHVHPEPRSPRTTFTTPPNVVPKTPEPRSPEPSRTIIEPSTSSSRQRAVTSAAFDRFWAVYPKKVEKKTAQAKFSAAVKGGVDPERIISAAAAYAKSPSVAGGFVKHPTTWLNAGCWDDEPPQQIPNPTERDSRRSFLIRVASRGAA